MNLSTAEALSSFRAFPAEEQRALFADIIRDAVARDGRDATLQLLLPSLFGPPTSATQGQAETLAAFARLPEDVAAALLTPVDPATVRVEDCLSDAEVARLTAGPAALGCP